MVLQKRLDYGFSGYQVPPTPRAMRSARKRGCFKKRNEDSQICAFDLLAIVAGNLLVEARESAPSSSKRSAGKDQHAVVNNTIKKEWQDEENLLKVGAHDQGNPASNFFVSDLSQIRKQNDCTGDSLYVQNNLDLGLASATPVSGCAQRYHDEKLVNGKAKIEMETFTSKLKVGSAGYREFGDYKLGVETKRLVKAEPQKSEKVLKGTVTNTCSSQDKVIWGGKLPAPASSDSSSKVPFCGDRFSTGYPINRDDANVVGRDDDENSSGCTHPSTTKESFRAAPRIGDRRIRKILASKYWKVAPRLKDVTHSSAGRDLKPVYHKRKNFYKYQRCERIYPFKKRKHFACISPSTSGGGITSEFVLDSTRKSNSGRAPGSYGKLHGATGASSSITGQHTSFQPRNSHVKLRIKSFRVPELVIEIPESATVGLLKRTVMEAVTAILGGGLGIGVLLQGKKVRDDNKTLLQTGISHNNQLDTLGFSLEANPSQTSPALNTGDSSPLPPCESPQPLSRYLPTACVVHKGDFAAFPEPHVTNLGNFVESDHDSAPSLADLSIDKCATDSKALVPVPAVNVDALDVVAAHWKSKRSEIVQRRIRRPFSVAEVESLVQAVEKLGTGRWRDVKLRAFDNAKHRTYVDLKDKWKTLVHTARISPQQRRGEPVPQELLDRVLVAHAYWSQQQAKQQLKQLQPETCLLL